MSQDASAGEVVELNALPHGRTNVLQTSRSPVTVSSDATSPLEELVEPVSPVDTHSGRDSIVSQPLPDCASNHEASPPRINSEQGPSSGVTTSIPRIAGGDEVSSPRGGGNASEEDSEDSEAEGTTSSSSSSGSSTLMTGSVKS